MRHAHPLAAALVIALACGAAHAQWKWRDASGRVTASDLPPPALVPERDILSRPADIRHTAAAGRPASGTSVSTSVVGSKPVALASTDPELEARRRRAAEEKVIQDRQLQERNAATSADNCNRARAYIAVLSDGRRVARTNAKGEVETVDDKGRAEEIERTRALMASECK